MQFGKAGSEQIQVECVSKNEHSNKGRWAVKGRYEDIGTAHAPTQEEHLRPGERVTDPLCFPEGLGHSSDIPTGELGVTTTKRQGEGWTTPSTTSSPPLPRASSGVPSGAVQGTHSGYPAGSGPDQQTPASCLT